MGLRPRECHFAARDRLGKIFQIEVVDAELTIGLIEQPGHNHGEAHLAASGRPDDGRVLGQVQFRGQRFDDRIAAVVRVGNAGGHQFSRQGPVQFLIGNDVFLLQQADRLELRNDLLVFDPRVLLLLIILQQLFPRRVHFLVRREHGDQSANRQRSLDCQISPDGKEKEGPQLGEEVVEKLDEKFLAIDIHSDAEDTAQLVRVFCQLILRRIMGVNLLGGGKGLADSAGEGANQTHAGLAELVHSPLQLGDQINLHRIQRHGGQPHDVILHHQKRKGGEQYPALKGRQGKAVPHEATQWLHFRGDHGHDLPL